MINPFGQCLDEIADAGDEWATLHVWLSQQAARFDAKPRHSQFTNPARAAMALSGPSLIGRGELRQKLTILLSHFQEQENDSRCLAANS
jgi:hypothetical protein